MQLFFAVTLFVSATLLFVVEPMFAKMVLPKFGGSPSVWNTCLVFYQGSLLLGYLYAHFSVKWLGARWQAVVHLLLLCLPWCVLPLGVAREWVPPPGESPVLWLWLLLAAKVGLPFLFVSASAPMLQAWFAAAGQRTSRDPYFLYAASNLGSMIALLSYPLVMEPRLTLAMQSWWWTLGYGVLVALTFGCAVWLWRSPRGDAVADQRQTGQQQAGEGSMARSEPPTWGRRLRWLALALVPSSLLLGVTSYISTDLAPVPLLWVIPLALYLLTFVLVFARRRLLPHVVMVWTQPLLVVGATAMYFLTGFSAVQVAELSALHLLAFFVTAMVCHGELAADRPDSRYLTEFYLWMSLGGVLGGLFNALVAPLIFSSVIEYPLMIAAACFLRPWPPRPARPDRALWLDFTAPLALLLVFGPYAWVMHWASLKEWHFLERFTKHMDSTPAKIALMSAAAAVALIFLRRPLRFGLAVVAILIVSYFASDDEDLRLLHRQRTFFGVLRVREDTKHKTHDLLHGSTLHGVQSLDPKKALQPWTYYHRNGPVGDLFEELENSERFRKQGKIGVIGLGTGSIAAYGQPRQKITFFEIDPAVQAIAENNAYFTYLTNCRANRDVVLGDARLSLQQEPPRQFDVLLVDAFSSDSIPVHLLTREALQLYFKNLTERGLLAVHISNRHLDLEPVLGNLAADAPVEARVCKDSEGGGGKYSSTWVVLARKAEYLGDLDDNSDWQAVKTDPSHPVWTDDYSNIVSVIDWEFPDLKRMLWPPNWWRSSEE